MEQAIHDHINALALILDDQSARLKEIEDETDPYRRCRLLIDLQRCCAVDGGTISGGRSPAG